MRIVQIIDSLERGGAERMAVSYANALATKVEFSGLIVTRAEGTLKEQIGTSVKYLYLKKQSFVDLNAVLKCREFCALNKVDIIHAHSTSYFLAVLIKNLLPNIKIIWHNHNGLSENLSPTRVRSLRLASSFISGTIVVNRKLEEWTKNILQSKNVVYLENFTVDDITEQDAIALKGKDGARIIYVANLRQEKNHQMLLEIAKKIIPVFPDWTFHLVGKDFEDSYSQRLRELIVSMNLEKSVFLYGSQINIKNLLRQSEIAVLTSSQEGLPVSVLEYGKFGLPVVVTAVGELPTILESGINGFLVESGDIDGFCENIQCLIKDKNLREQLGSALNSTICNQYSEEVIIQRYLNWIETC